jgi:PAS domain S-box-containing protein
VSVADLIAQLLLVSRSDANIAADRDGVICFWNPGAERIFGYVCREAVGRSLDLSRLREFVGLIMRPSQMIFALRPPHRIEVIL